MIEIGRFKIDLEMRTLQQDGKVVPLGSRAFDILATVASAGGRLVTKDELMNAVWPETVVEENNIQVHLSALRKILGTDRDLILTVPGRGYQLLQRKKQAGDETQPPANTQRPGTGRLPRPKAQLVGRDIEVAQIRATLKDAHVLTLTSLRDEARPGGRFSVDPLVFCNGTLARIVLLQGDPETAMMIVDKTVDLVDAETMEPSLTHVLGTVAVPLALMSGDLRRGRHYLEIMRSQAALHRFDTWNDCCECLSGCFDILDGHIEAGLLRLEAGLDALLARGFRRLVTPFIVASAEALVAVGRLTQASARLRDALEFCQHNGEMFFLPEVWRALGVLAQAQANQHGRGSKAFTEKMACAFGCFTDAIDLARKQGARWWELRASIALANLLREHGRHGEALERLDTLAPCFKRSCAASDVQALFALIDSLHAASCDAYAPDRMPTARAAQAVA